MNNFFKLEWEYFNCWN